MKIVLQGERPVSWNDFYAGTHWRKRKEEADRVHQLIKYSIPPSKRVAFFDKVNILITAYFKNRPYDSDNSAGKLYIDGLKNVIIIDDAPKYVGLVGTRSEVDKENPRVEIDIEAV